MDSAMGGGLCGRAELATSKKISLGYDMRASENSPHKRLCTFEMQVAIYSRTAHLSTVRTKIFGG